ncbi:MAG: beta-lactamase family protein, partial [Asticcacaulis sp.]|nr:beta-lactamase family protein [Asticcacaulis sp.]
MSATWPGKGEFIRRQFLAGAAVIAVSGSAAGSMAAVRAPHRGLPRDFLDRLRLWMTTACLPGLSMARLERGVVTNSVHVGLANAETGQQVTGDTLFEACSMSKPVFAYGVLKLSEAGVIDLDRPLSAYFLPDYYPDDPLIRTITARHVLSHSSGLPPWGDENKPESFKPGFEPGRYFSYSGEGYFWLQLVVEHVTGLGLDPVMRQHLFEPAGMRSSYFAGFEALASRAAFGHRIGKVAADQGWRNVLGQTEPLAAKWGKPLRDWTQTDWLRAGAELVPSSPPKRLRFTNAAASLL